MLPTASSEKPAAPAAVQPAQIGITISRSVFVTRLLLVVGLVNMVLIGTAIRSIEQSRHLYEERTEITTQNLARVLAGHVSDSVSRIDLTVLTVVDEVEQQLASAEGITPAKLTAFIERHAALLPSLDGLRVVNLEGENACGIGINPDPRSNVADHPWMRSLVTSPSTRYSASFGPTGKFAISGP